MYMVYRQVNTENLSKEIQLLKKKRTKQKFQNWRNDGIKRYEITEESVNLKTSI